jgi:hypothetical protein
MKIVAYICGKLSYLLIQGRQVSSYHGHYF